MIKYVDMVADLFHYGHVEYLKECKKTAQYLIVGIHNDEDVKTYKRQPVMTMEERMKVVEACKYVDKVIPNAPLIVTKDFLTENNIDKIIHADDIVNQGIKIMYSDVIEYLELIPYTANISTTEILNRIKILERLS